MTFVFAANAVASLALVTMSNGGNGHDSPFLQPLSLLGCIVFALTPWSGVKYVTPGYILSRIIANTFRVDKRRTDAFFVGTYDDLDWEFFGRATALRDWKP